MTEMQEQNDNLYDWEKEVELGVADLKQKGLVETYYNEEGELSIRLTPKGKRFAQSLTAYKYN